MTGGPAPTGGEAAGRAATGGARRAGSGERGSASVLLAGVMGVVVLLAFTAVLVAGYAVGYRRARTAADLAAVSGAAAFASGGDACGQARRTAADNGATVEQCEQVGDLIDFVVTVRVGVTVASMVPGLPRRLRAEAHAGSV